MPWIIEVLSDDCLSQDFDRGECLHSENHKRPCAENGCPLRAKDQGPTGKPIPLDPANGLQAGVPFPEVFFCETLQHSITRSGCLMRRGRVHGILVEASRQTICETPPILDFKDTAPAHPHCAECRLGLIQQQIRRIEEQEDNGGEGN
jgi:hypothetical protein